MKIAVLSDTHMPKRARYLPDKVMEGIKGVDMVIHAGDLNSDSVIYELEEIAPLEAVAGNTDDEYITRKLGRKSLIETGGIKIGIIHGDGAYGTTLDRAIKAFAGVDVKCIVFGHSHVPYNEVVNGVLMFNPGSPTDKRMQKQFSYGILNIENGQVAGEIIFFD